MAIFMHSFFHAGHRSVTAKSKTLALNEGRGYLRGRFDTTAQALIMAESRPRTRTVRFEANNGDQTRIGAVWSRTSRSVLQPGEQAVDIGQAPGAQGGGFEIIIA